MEKDTVSIVIPIYNSEKYLNRCIESMVNQTYRNVEIILVDDGSPDLCPQICDEWAARDSRIKVIHKENQGQGIARNTGMEIATGKYICFFDSDDYIEKDTIEQTYNLAQEEKAEIVVFGITCVDAQGRVIRKEVPSPVKSVYAGNKVQEELLPDIVGANPKTGVSANIPFNVCCSFFSTDLIKRAKWSFVSERKIISEDGYSLIALYRHVQKVAVLPKALYVYCENESSFSHTFRPDRYERNRYFYIECIKLCKDCGYSKEVAHRCAEPFLRNTIAAMKQEVACHDGKSAIKRLRVIVDDEILQEVLRKICKDKTNLKKRIFYWATRHRLYIVCYALLSAKNVTTRK